jgi:hypothetical protein
MNFPKVDYPKAVLVVLLIALELAALKWFPSEAHSVIAAVGTGLAALGINNVISKVES